MHNNSLAMISSECNPAHYGISKISKFRGLSSWPSGLVEPEEKKLAPSASGRSEINANNELSRSASFSLDDDSNGSSRFAFESIRAALVISF